MPTAKLDPLAKRVLADVLADFLAKNLSSDALSEEYEGCSIQALSAKSCGDERHSTIDFDLALKALEEGGFIRTGPHAPFDNDPNSAVFVLSLVNKREFACLAEKGYREAQKAPPEKKPPAPTVHISGGHFTNSPLAIGENIQQTTTINVHNDAEVVRYLLDLLGKDNLPAGTTEEKEICGLIDAAKDGNLPMAQSMFKRVFGAATETVKGLAYAIIAEIIKAQFSS